MGGALPSLVFAGDTFFLNAALAQTCGWPTCSSPIAINPNDRLLWVVNPGDDPVSVIRPDNN